MTMTRRSMVAVLLLATLAAAPGWAADRPGVVTVERGGLARWSGPGTEACGMDGKTWAALDETCWYPVDIERSPGHVEIARWQNGVIEKAWLVITDAEFEFQEITIDDRFVHLAEADLARHYSQQYLVKRLFRRRGPARFDLPLQPPADPLPAARDWGARRSFNGVVKKPHTGVDYAVTTGTSIKAAADGTVVLVGEHFFAGTSVYLDHGDGLITMYFHLSEILVEEGSEVTRNSEIARSGSNGRSTGPHLHYGTYWRGARIDPTLVLGDPEAIPEVQAH